jgi:hypothetical protein
MEEYLLKTELLVRSVDDLVETMPDGFLEDTIRAIKVLSYWSATVRDRVKEEVDCGNV